MGMLRGFHGWLLVVLVLFLGGATVFLSMMLLIGTISLLARDSCLLEATVLRVVCDCPCCQSKEYRWQAGALQQHPCCAVNGPNIVL